MLQIEFGLRDAFFPTRVASGAFQSADATDFELLLVKRFLHELNIGFRRVFGLAH